MHDGAEIVWNAKVGGTFFLCVLQGTHHADVVPNNHQGSVTQEFRKRNRTYVGHLFVRCWTTVLLNHTLRPSCHTIDARSQTLTLTFNFDFDVDVEQVQLEKYIGLQCFAIAKIKRLTYLCPFCTAHGVSQRHS